MKKVLITGIHSYVGCNLKEYLNKNFVGEYDVHCITMRNDDWKQLSFSSFDVIVHVAGLAHVDVASVDEKTKQDYYKVNAEMTEEIAMKAISDGVRQFIYMSSIIVYSAYKGGCIDKNTPVVAENFYGDSKIKAEEKLSKLEKKNMKIAVLRPPMIYGKESKGNYPLLAKLALKVPIFPATKNRRSMLYIENLCEFIRLLIENEDEGLFFPQNREYTDTATLIKEIAEVRGKKVRIMFCLHWMVSLAKRFPGKYGILAEKAFGNLYYDATLSEYKTDYRIFDFKESVKRTESI